MLSVLLEACVEDDDRRADLMTSFMSQRSMPLARFAGISYACLKKHLESTEGGYDSTMWERDAPSSPGGQSLLQSMMGPQRSIASVTSKSDEPLHMTPERNPLDSLALALDEGHNATPQRSRRTSLESS